MELFFSAAASFQISKATIGFKDVVYKGFPSVVLLSVGGSVDVEAL